MLLGKQGASFWETFTSPSFPENTTEQALFGESAGPTAQRRARPSATIHLSDELPVYCYLFQILFTVSVRGALGPCIVIHQ